MPGGAATHAIHVEGLGGLLRAFSNADKTRRDDLKDALQEAAAPVRSEAQQLAGTKIPHMGGAHKPWAAMRIGAYSSIVYVAPVERGVKGRGGQNRRRGHRFASLMLERAMEPALEHNTAIVERRLEGLIDEVCDVWERTPGDG